MQEIKVALLIETDDQWGRTIVQRILQLATGRNWRLLIAPRDSQHRLRLPRGWDGHGVIASLRDHALARHLRNSGLPVVDVSAMEPKADWFGRVATDDQARARMAVDYLLGRGFQNFATYAPQLGRYGGIRSQQFAKELQRRGHSCQHFDSGSSLGWQLSHRTVEHWLKTLPTPIAIFAADPHPARQLAEVCLFGDLPIPESIAILSGDDDDLLCDTAHPFISAVQLNCMELAERATAMLSKALQTNQLPQAEELVSPLQVRQRSSTDLLLYADPLIRRFLQFAETSVAHPFDVNAVAQTLSVSRRQLELRTRRFLGKSPGQILKSARLKHIKKMLIETDATITQIAYQNGFASSAALTQQFKREFGCVPCSFRRWKAS